MACVQEIGRCCVTEIISTSITTLTIRKGTRAKRQLHRKTGRMNNYMLLHCYTLHAYTQAQDVHTRLRQVLHSKRKKYFQKPKPTFPLPHLDRSSNFKLSFPQPPVCLTVWTWTRNGIRRNLTQRFLFLLGLCSEGGCTQLSSMDAGFLLLLASNTMSSYWPPRLDRERS